MLGDDTLLRIVAGVIFGFAAFGPFGLAADWPITTVTVVIDLPPPSAP